MEPEDRNPFVLLQVIVDRQSIGAELPAMSGTEALAVAGELLNISQKMLQLALNGSNLIPCDIRPDELTGDYAEEINRIPRNQSN